ncbi:MAG: hypothetical protein M3Q99_18215 [Acidobacteriota bacterium]|nr:hypothetical protein [Acidobacteriota bacterium]
MDIQFTGKYKSITDFVWNDIPNFVVITGINGTGKSQLLELIYITLINRNGTTERVSIAGKTIQPDEVTFLKGEWQLDNTGNVDLSSILSQSNSYYGNFISGSFQPNQEGYIRHYYAFQKILKRSGKSNPREVTKQEFDKFFPEILIEQESQLSQKISEVFYNYRLSEIELQAKHKTEEEIKNEIGEKPWKVLREIIKESKLPFKINDPENNGLRDAYQLKLTHTILNEEINFSNLSSGEKVLISLVFYLYKQAGRNIVI